MIFWLTKNNLLPILFIQVKNSSLKIRNVGLNPTRTGFYQLLKKQGADIKFKNLKKKK